MIKKSSLFLSLLLSLGISACTAEQPVEELTKDEVRALPIDDKGDHFDWCEAFGWYDDGVCDTFCNNPDPDCSITCEVSDCPDPPQFQPRPCLDGSFIFGSAECVADLNGECGLEIDGGSCPEDRVCEMSDCPTPPEFSPRPCDDGSVVFGSADCVADLNGECGLEIDGGSCPEDNQ